MNSKYITELNMLKNTSLPIVDSYNATFYSDAPENLGKLFSSDLSQ